ncbi:hypothetical protein WME88_10910 [Sorangium sp. So ce216]
MRSFSPRLSSAGMLLAAVLLAAGAFAQTSLPLPQAKEIARTLADRGLEHYDNGRYHEALQAFNGAEAALHAPSLLLMIARTYDKLGRLIESRATYHRLIDEELAPGSPRAFMAAKDEAKLELAALEPRIPTLEVTVTGTTPGAAELTVDGDRIVAATPVELNPGEHRLVAALTGERSVTKVLQLKEGTREHVLLDLTPRSPAAPLPDRAPTPSVSSASTVMLIGGGVAAGAGVLAGVAFTFAANSKASDAREQWRVVDAIDNGSLDCAKPDAGNPAQQCAKLSSLVDDKDLFTNAAMWTFIGAGAAALGTLGYYWVATSSSEPERRHFSVFPLVIPNGGGIVAGGAF